MASFAEDGAGNLYVLSARSGDVFRLSPARSEGPLIDVGAGLTRSQAAAGYPLIEGGFSVVKAGAGQVIFDAANSFTGPTTISAGTLTVADPLALAGSRVTVAAGGVLSAGSGVIIKSPEVRLDGGGSSRRRWPSMPPTGLDPWLSTQEPLQVRTVVTVGSGGGLTLAAGARLTVGLTRLAVDETVGGGKLDLGSGQVLIAAGGIAPAALRTDLLAAATEVTGGE